MVELENLDQGATFADPDLSTDGELERRADVVKRRVASRVPVASCRKRRDTEGLDLLPLARLDEYTSADGSPDARKGVKMKITTDG